MVHQFETRVYEQGWEDNLQASQDGISLPQKDIFLAADIGGTNSNFGVFEMRDNNLVLLISLHLKSALVTDYALVIKEFVELVRYRYQLHPQGFCLGIAGIVTSDNLIKPTNLPVTINVAQLREAAGMPHLFCLSDFQICALGIEQLDSSKLIPISQGKTVLHAQRACLGAGTGLGKSTLFWSRAQGRYLAAASEGGHADAIAYTAEERDLFAFVQATRGGSDPVSWENLLAGRGLQAIYRFYASSGRFQKTEVAELIEREGFKPDLISAYAADDACCAETLVSYTKFYGRCAKNYALEAVALGGMYIAGGIAAKNIDIFRKSYFMEEFTKADKHQEALKNIPVFVIADYNVSLYGAALAAVLREQGIL